MMINVIVNADDLGMSESINASIFDHMERRNVTSATILAQAPEARMAARHHHHFPQCTFGAHLSLTEFRPMTHHGYWNELGILDDDGHFKKDAIRKVLPTLKVIHAVTDEWVAQITTLCEWGITVSHLDSHQYVHTIPWLFPALKRVQKRFGIRRVRSTQSIYGPDIIPPSMSLKCLKYFWNSSLKHFYTTKTPDEFTSLSQCVESLNESLWTPKKIGSMTIELMTHPGQTIEPKEVELLKTPITQLLPFACELVSYRDF